MKHLILFYGRTGSTMVYSSILDYHSLVRGNTSELHSDNFMDATDWFADKDDWVLKMHINTGIDIDHYSNLLEYFLNKEKIDKIYFSYREDIFDTYLSYAVAINSDIWNSDTKQEYTPIGVGILPDHVSVRQADNIVSGSDLLLQCARNMENSFERWYANQVRLFAMYNIIPISYEDMVTTGKITNDLPMKTRIVKQNTLKEKLSLFEDKRIVYEHFNNHLKKYSWDNGRIVK